LRPDRVAPPATRLPWRWLRPDDGWSDAPEDPCYHRPVAHPHPFSAERLWRDDHLYDIILVLGWNDAPVVPGRGSAIFWHAMAADGGPTEGCIACPLDRLKALLPTLGPGMQVEILPS
jgi:L,D-peptidoglycan transpeptidase YkuD (ErfK/YbiS/YcfS/YnhG family)